MLKSLITKLNEPFPESAFGKEKVIEQCYIGLFVAGFLFFFNPFGLQNMPLGIVVSSIIFGLITIVFSLSYYWFCFAVLKIKTDVPEWTLWKWLLFVCLMTCWIAVGNFVYLAFSMPENFDFANFPTMLQYTIMVGITPIVVGGMLIQLNAAKQNQKQAQEVAKPSTPSTASEASEQISFDISNDNALTVQPEDIIFIEAMQNYLMVHYTQGDSNTQTIQHQMIRSTLAKAAQKTAHSALIRCHRSFIVNPLKVIQVDGNAQGLKLKIDGIEKREIPVSRSYIDAFKTAMAEINA